MGAAGFEPATLACEASALPLSYAPGRGDHCRRSAILRRIESRHSYGERRDQFGGVHEARSGVRPWPVAVLIHGGFWRGATASASRTGSWRTSRVAAGRLEPRIPAPRLAKPGRLAHRRSRTWRRHRPPGQGSTSRSTSTGSWPSGTRPAATSPSGLWRLPGARRRVEIRLPQRSPRPASRSPGGCARLLSRRGQPVRRRPAGQVSAGTTPPRRSSGSRSASPTARARRGR